jgi:molybdate transport system ATP-binding protein
MSEPRRAGDGIRLKVGWRRDGFDLDVALDLALRGITGIFGPSGAGKSTLLRCLAGLERPDSAEFRVGGRVLDDSANGIRIAVHERGIGYVFQEPRLFAHLDVGGNLDYSLKRRRGDGGPGRDEIVELLQLEPLLRRRIATLSGGEAQRVAIGRALLSAPRLMLMDEPVSALDVERRNDVLPFVERVHAEFDVPILYVSHNIDEIALLCDQLVVMQRGRVIADGPLSRVLERTELPVLGGAEASAVVRASVDEYDAEYDITRVRIDGGTLWLPGRHAEAHAGLRVRIRANDVSLAADRVPSTSILNVLDASVAAVERESTHSLLVHLDAGGTRLLSRITRKSAERLGIEPGMRLLAQIKAISVRPASL